MPLDIEQLPGIYTSWRTRYEERSLRIELIDRAVAGEFDVFDPDEESISSRSPNLIQVALEDTAEAASLMPSIRVQPTKTGKTAKSEAATMERIATSYLEANDFDLKIPRTIKDMAAYGLGVWTILPDDKEMRPLIERRDPRHCYPEPGYRPGDPVNRAFFARSIYFTQLPEKFQIKVMEHAGDVDTMTEVNENSEVIIIEWFDKEEVVVGALFAQQATPMSSDVVFYPVELERIEHGVGICPVVIGARQNLDNEFRGQFDQVIGMLEAHIQLMGLTLDYADQAVYSDIWVRDLIGEMPYGGGAYIELGPQGAIGRIPPAVSSLNVQADLQALIEGIHLGGRWPKTRPGDIDQSIASAKFVEATAGVMNTAIRTYHQILQHMMEQSLRIAFKVDKMLGGSERSAVGILRNQSFLIEYDPSKINLAHRVRVEYGLGLGRDPAQSAVLHIQYGQNEYVSKEFVQENIDGLTDVARESARIDNEKFRSMALAKLLQGLEAGTIPEKALIEIAREREQGMDLFDLYEKYIVEPAEAAAAQLVPTGLGAPMQPGPPGIGAPPGPGGPGPGGPGQPPVEAPPGSDLLARLNVPGGPGGTLGSQVLQQGA